MTKRAKRTTRDVLADLIDRPPLNDGELGRRLRGVDRGDARREIVDRLFDGSAPRDALEMLATALLVLGIEGQETRLERIVADARRDRGERWTALSLIFSASPERANRTLSRLAPEDALPLMLQPATEALEVLVAEPAAASTIVEALEALPREVRAEAIAHLEVERRRAGTPAVLAYRELLQRDELGDLHGVAIDAIVAEGGAQTASELAQLRDEAQSPKARQAFQRALLRLGTRAIETPPRAIAAGGEAHLGFCDGQGAFVLLACFTNTDGTTSVADLCVRANGEIRDGFALAALSQQEVSALFVKMRASGIGELAPLSLDEAAAVAFAGVERTRRAEVSVPEDARSALFLFERTGSGHRAPRALPEITTQRGPVTLDEARALLALPRHDSWFFDAGDLSGAGITIPRARRKPRADWLDAALAKLGATAVAPRVAAMLGHMARWYTLKGEPRHAALCARAREEAEQSFPAGAVPRAMLERSVEILRAEAAPRTGMVGDPEVRDRIRLRLFQDVNDPKGRDLAVLDLTEAALAALDSALQALPGSRRPREEDVLQAAYALGALFARWVLARRRMPLPALTVQMSKALAQMTVLDPDELTRVVGVVLPALASFVGEVCGTCPVGCLSRPRADVADAFFAAEHPAFG